MTQNNCYGHPPTNYMFWLYAAFFRFWCSFDKRWSIEWWISVGWQQPKVRRILRGGWVVGHAIGNWRGNWDGTFQHFLGRFLCGFGCIPWYHPIGRFLFLGSGCTPPFLPLALPHKERLYTGLSDSGKCNSDKKYHQRWRYNTAYTAYKVA